MQARPPPRNTSRIVAIAAVCLLLIVAVAGIVLARRTAGPQPSVTPPAAQRMPFGSASSTRAVAAAPTPSANEVVFDSASDRLPSGAAESIARFVKSTKGIDGKIRMTARFPNGANKAQDQMLAKARAAAVRQRLQLNGIKPEQMQMELIEMPAGSVSERDANRIELSLR